MAALDPDQPAPPVLVLGTPDAFIAQGTPAQILSELGLDGRGIAASVSSALKAHAEARTWHPIDRS